MADTESSVFFQGGLQDGINFAVQQGKAVVAFVTDDEDQSTTWENEFLTNDTLRLPLESKAVVLRLLAGSEEAGFLEAMFPVPKKPTAVIIQNGMLKEYIGSNATREDFIRRLAASLNQVAAPPPAQGQTLSDETLSQATSQMAARLAAHSGNDEEASSTAGGSSSRLDSSEQQQDPQPQAQPDAQAQSRAQVAALLVERARRLEVDKKAKEAKEKAEKEARAKQRREVTESNEGQSHNINAAERSYAEAVRHRKIQAAEERKRILKRIEDDKRERKEREAQERQARLLLSAAQDDDGGSTSHAPPPISIPLSRRQGGDAQGGDFCNLQVRLFDGSTLRARFKSDATPGGEVRRWVDEERTDGDAPYTFRVLLTPSPGRAIEPTEEIRSLLSLGLAPSATLVLVRARYAAAYAGADNRNIVSKSYAYILGIFGAVYAFLFGGVVGMLFGRGRGGGGGRAQRQRQQQHGEEVPLQDLGARRAGSRIRGFENPEDRRDAQLYNGNSLNFEPRRDDDEDGGSS